MLTPYTMHVLQEVLPNWAEDALAKLHGNAEDLYNIYTIRTGKSGKKRTIEEPCEELKLLQHDLVALFSQVPLHRACMARKGYSIIDNAARHRDAKHLLRIDIRKCYPSLTRGLIRHALNACVPKNKDFNPMSIALEYCLIGEDEHLPTGAPTSPILCNIALTPFDHAMQTVADDAGYAYTRYIDDIHLSTKEDIRDWKLINTVKALLKHYDLRVNDRKTRWSTANARDPMYITGVKLEGDCRVPRPFRRMLRAKLQNLALSNKSIDAETQGCLAYVKSIDEPRYQQLINYYQRRRAYAPSN